MKFEIMKIVSFLSVLLSCLVPAAEVEAQGCLNSSGAVQNLKLQEIDDSPQETPAPITLEGHSYKLGRDISSKTVKTLRKGEEIIDGYKNDLYVSPNGEYYFLVSYDSHEHSASVNNEGFDAETTTGMTLKLFHGSKLVWSVSIPDAEKVAWNDSPAWVFDDGGVLLEGDEPRNSDLEGGPEAAWYRIYDRNGKKIFETNRRDNGFEFAGSTPDCAVFHEEIYEGNNTIRKVLAVNLSDDRQITFDIHPGEYFSYLAPDMNSILVRNNADQHMLDAQGKVKWVLSVNQHLGFIRSLCEGKVLAFQESDFSPLKGIGKGSKRIVYYDAETFKEIKSVPFPSVAKPEGDYNLELLDLAEDGSLAVFVMAYDIKRSPNGGLQPLKSRIGIMNSEGKLVAAFEGKQGNWKFSDDVQELVLNYRGGGRDTTRKPKNRFKLIKYNSN